MTYDHQTLLDFAEDINAWLSEAVEAGSASLADLKAYRDKAREIIDQLEMED